MHSEEHYLDLDFAVPAEKELMLYLDEKIGDYKIHPTNAKLSVQKQLMRYRKESRDVEVYILRIL